MNSTAEELVALQARIVTGGGEMHAADEGFDIGYWGNTEPDRNKISATPFSWPDPATIPPRQWLFGWWYQRGEITAVVSPGGLGKSMLLAGTAISMASGLDFLKCYLPEKACRVWLWNLEDGRDELARQVTACAMHHGLTAADCEDRLYVDSGLDMGLCTAIEGENGFEIVEPVYAALKAEILRRKIDVLVIDPFVSSHAVAENDNVIIDRVAKRWKRLATETNIAIVLVHHTSKSGGKEITADSSRGASALVNAARSTLVLNPMTKEDGERFGITDKRELRHFVRVDDDKPNRAPPQSAAWFRKASYALGNRDEYGRTDSVGAIERWTPPDPFDGINLRHLYDVQQTIAAGEYGANVQANDWAGQAVAQVIDADLDDPADKSRVKSLLRQWTDNKAFKIETRAVAGRSRKKPYLVVGEAVDPSLLTTSQGGVAKGG
jgi:hypothetical protein